MPDPGQRTAVNMFWRGRAAATRCQRPASKPSQQNAERERTRRLRNAGMPQQYAQRWCCTRRRGVVRCSDPAQWCVVDSRRWQHNAVPRPRDSGEPYACQRNVCTAYKNQASNTYQDAQERLFCCQPRRQRLRQPPERWRALHRPLRQAFASATSAAWQSPVIRT